jgi:hypothetical protein
LVSPLHTKQQSKQWTEAGCSAPKKTRSVSSAGKVMASVFWDAEGILFIDYLEKGKTITGEYYSNLLTRLDEKNREKKPGLKKKNIPIYSLLVINFLVLVLLQALESTSSYPCSVSAVTATTAYQF